MNIPLACHHTAKVDVKHEAASEWKHILKLIDQLWLKSLRIYDLFAQHFHFTFHRIDLCAALAHTAETRELQNCFYCELWRSHFPSPASLFFIPLDCELISQFIGRTSFWASTFVFNLHGNLSEASWDELECKLSTWKSWINSKRIHNLVKHWADWSNLTEQWDERTRQFQNETEWTIFHC